MTVQTIPSIEDMTTLQRTELMEELWKAMSRRPEDIPVPDWHLEVLREREIAVEKGEDEFVDFEDAIVELKQRIELRRRP